jgi:hypothetical protein
MARALAQHRSDESEVRHQETLSGVVVVLAARSEVSHRMEGRRGIEFEFAEISNGSVSRLQGRVSGVEVAQGWRYIRRFSADCPTADNCAGRRLFFQEKIKLSARQ